MRPERSPNDGAPPGGERPTRDRPTSPHDDRAAEARRVLDRLDSEAETLLGGTARRLADHFAGRDADADDAIERWGRRIGRALSVVLAVALSWWLGSQLGWW